MAGGKIYYRGRGKRKAPKTAVGRLKRDVQKLKRMAGHPEYKQYTATDAPVNVDYDGTVDNIFTPSQGDGSTDRDGDSCQLARLTMRGFFNSSGDGFESFCRLIVFIDPENKSSSASDVLDSQFLGTNMAVHAPKDYQKRFNSKILYDRTFWVPDPAIISRKPNFKITIPINKKVMFNSGGTTIYKNALKLLYVSDRGSMNLPQISWIGRMTFLDN